MRRTEFPHARGKTIARMARVRPKLYGEMESTVPYGSRSTSASEPAEEVVVDHVNAAEGSTGNESTAYHLLWWVLTPGEGM